mmetsp:Transcript_25131/g.42426  ORF Transcript_25131/g.42426 Transcript_25131/m.42426 type:complete len:339 (-) Transcript_25131:272-1288(-)
MGCGSSTTFKVKEGIPGQDKYAMEAFRRFHLSDKDIHKMYAAFIDMDADTSRYIRRDEFCAYFHVETTPVIVKMVKMMDTEQHGCLDFCEMVALLWDFLSRDTKSLGSFAFHLFDTKNDGVLSIAEVTRLIEMLHHTTMAKSKIVKKVVDDLVKHVDGVARISVQTFHEYCQVHEDVCLSLFGLQHNLRERILGDHFWDVIVENRKKDKEQLSLNYIQDVLAETKAQKIKDAMEMEEKEEDKSGKKNNKNGRRRSSYIGHFFEKGVGSGKRPEAYRIPQQKRITRQNSHGKDPPNLAHKKANRAGSSKKRHKKKGKHAKVSDSTTDTASTAASETKAE